MYTTCLTVVLLYTVFCKRIDSITFLIAVQGTYAIPRAQAEREMNENLANVKGNQPAIKDSFGKKSSPKHDVVEDMDDDEESMDWWTKYFASVDAMIEVMISTTLGCNKHIHTNIVL